MNGVITLDPLREDFVGANGNDENLTEFSRREMYRIWRQEELLPRFEGHCLAIYVPVLLRRSRLVADLERQGRSLPAKDAKNAAPALHKAMDLATRHEADSF